jgi:hypothetical protein
MVLFESIPICICSETDAHRNSTVDSLIGLIDRSCKSDSGLKFQSQIDDLLEASVYYSDDIFLLRLLSSQERQIMP